MSATATSTSVRRTVNPQEAVNPEQAVLSAEAVSERRLGTRAGLHPGGPRVVALGGGYGLSTTLRAARRYASAITGIVSVADDGGSSGRLRQAFGIPAPGDLRRCLVAMAEPDSVWAAAFEHRFAASELEGHALGNIVIAKLAVDSGLNPLLAILLGIAVTASRPAPHCRAPASRAGRGRGTRSYRPRWSATRPS